uniref:Uncharacterized protein n=1 Tax=Vespula pensylvanica TaxID=30213 RepID=A0A834P711_VESPE|nr:hypothetical protein H0235_004279 [Vespula pensylvanica]
MSSISNNLHGRMLPEHLQRPFREEEEKDATRVGDNVSRSTRAHCAVSNPLTPSLSNEFEASRQTEPGLTLVRNRKRKLISQAFGKQQPVVKCSARFRRLGNHISKYGAQLNATYNATVLDMCNGMKNVTRIVRLERMKRTAVVVATAVVVEAEVEAEAEPEAGVDPKSLAGLGSRREQPERG